jgi:Right handed beta helix region
MKIRISFLLGLGLLLIVASSAHAQPPRTWVSESGNDDNDCSRPLPCKTFAGAISKTAARGEISVLDPGDFGSVTITKSITINGGSALAGIQVGGANAVIVNVTAPVTVDPGVVILRGLSINGGGVVDPVTGSPVPGLNGIRYLAGTRLVIENCSIYGFSQSGIEVSLTGAKNLVVKNSALTDDVAGINLTNTTGAGTLAQVTNSLIAGNTGFGVHAAGKSTISVANSLLTNNGVAVQVEFDAVTGTQGTVRLSNNEIFDNGTGIVGCGGGRVASARNNREAGNGGGGCSPPARDNINVY